MGPTAGQDHPVQDLCSESILDIAAAGTSIIQSLFPFQSLFLGLSKDAKTCRILSCTHENCASPARLAGQYDVSLTMSESLGDQKGRCTRMIARPLFYSHCLVTARQFFSNH